MAGMMRRGQRASDDDESTQVLMYANVADEMSSGFDLHVLVRELHHERSMIAVRRAAAEWCDRDCVQPTASLGPAQSAAAIPVDDARRLRQRF